MKKKILAFIFGLCLIIPCMFIFSACGDEPPADDPTKWKIVTEATCTTEGLKKRTIDGNEETEKIPALGHNYGAWTITLNETCTTNGSKQQTCDRCNDIKTETILAHHTLDGTILFDDTEHWEHCTKCTEKVNAVEHDFKVTTRNNYIYHNLADWFQLSHIEEVNTCEHCEVEIKDTTRINSMQYTSEFTVFKNYLNDTTNNVEFMFKKYSLEYSLPSNFTYSDGQIEVIDNLYEIVQYYNEDGEITHSKYRVAGSNDEYSPLGAFEYVYTETGYTIKMKPLYMILSDELSAIIRFCYEFNNDGVLVKYYYVAPNDVVVYMEKTYEDKFIVYDKSVGNYYKNAQFDANGNRVYVEYHSTDNSTTPTKILNATYNANNQCTRIDIEVANSNTKYIEYLLTYNGENIASIVCNKKDAEGTITSTHTFNCEYSNTGVVVRDASNEVVYRIDYTQTRTTNI